MNASQAGIANFITSLRIHFPTRHDSEMLEIEWIRSIRDAISFYGDETLKAVAQRIIDTRTDRRFPLPAEIRKACSQVAVDSQKGKMSFEPKMGKSDAFSDHRVRLADELIVGPMGRRATKEGWILSLHDFCRKNARLPSDYEIKPLVTAALGFRDAYEEALRGGWPGARGLASLGDKMNARREELGKIVAGIRA